MVIVQGQSFGEDDQCEVRICKVCRFAQTCKKKQKQHNNNQAELYTTCSIKALVKHELINRLLCFWYAERYTPKKK